MANLNESNPNLKDINKISSVTLFRDFSEGKSEDELKKITANNYGRRIENSRFRIVKIALEHPYQQKRWTCYDYFDENINPKYSVNLDAMRNEFKRNAAANASMQITNQNSSKEENCEPTHVENVEKPKPQPRTPNSDRKKKFADAMTERKMNFELVTKKLRIQQESQEKQTTWEAKEVVITDQQQKKATEFDIQLFEQKLLQINKAALQKKLESVTRKVSRFQVNIRG